MSDHNVTQYTPEALADAQVRLANLTPEDVLDLELYIERLKEKAANSFPEAPAFVWAEFSTVNGGTISAGVRCASIREAWDTFMDGTAYAQSAYSVELNHTVKSPAGPTHTPVLPVQAVAPPVQMSISQSPAPTASVQHIVPPAPQAVAPKPVQQAVTPNGNIQSFTCVYIEITPQASGKTQVKFYGNSRKQPHDMYAELTTYMPATGDPRGFDLTTLFSPIGPWTAEMFQQAGSYEITPPMNVLWEYSTTNKDKNGNPYKNIKALAPTVVTT